MSYYIKDLKNVIDLVAEAMIASTAKLTELDSRSGDGDLGISMEKGAVALKREIDLYTDEDIGKLFVVCSVAFNKSAPSTMGTLISYAIMALGKEFKGKKEIEDEDTIRIPRIMAEAIMRIGKAQRGDKTILDSLFPLYEAIESSYNVNKDIKLAIKAASSAAAQGAKETKGMLAKAGRAKWIAERSKDYPDGGATLCAIIIEALVDK